MSTTFPAYVIDENGSGFQDLTLADLPDHDVLVEVEYSTVNYKDGLAISGRTPIARKLPMVAGIDLAGTVVESRSPDWAPGDRVLVNGWGLSETQWGGYSRFQRLKPEWLTRIPECFDACEVMAIGTAGYTAGLCVDVLEDWGRIRPGEGEVLVTGAAGGVGSFAISLLAARGYRVTAATGRPETHDYLRDLGASGFISRAELAEDKGRPLQKERWSGGVDSVGSTTLVNALAQTLRDGAIAACGLAGGADLPGTVMPHILRSVALLGVDSVMASPEKRARAWERLARDLDRTRLQAITTLADMADLPDLADAIIAGRIRGRVVVRISG